MPVLRLRPDEYISLEYKRPKSRWFEFEIDADRPVKTYIVGPKNLRRFEEGRKFNYVGGYPEERDHQRQKVWISFSGPVYLIISNPHRDKPVELEYDVYY